MSNETLHNISSVLFPIDYAIVSHYSLSECAICGENSFSEFDRHSKYFCPRCGRFVIGSSGIHYAFRDNMNCYASKCFNLLMKKQNNKYYVNQNKTPVFYDDDYDSHQLPKEFYEHYSYKDIEDKYLGVEDVEKKMHYILENLNLSLPNIQNSEFRIPKVINRLIRTMFFIDDRKMPVQTLEIYIGYLLEDKVIELTSENENGKIFRITRKGRIMANKPIEEISSKTPTHMDVHGDYVAGDKNDFSGSKVKNSIVNAKGNAVNEVEVSPSKNKKGKWNIGKKVVVALIVAAILAIIGFVLKNWNEIIALVYKP